MRKEPKNLKDIHRHKQSKEKDLKGKSQEP